MHALLVDFHALEVSFPIPRLTLCCDLAMTSQGPLASSWRLQPYCHMALRLAASSPPPLPFLHFLSISWCDEIITTAMQVDRAEVSPID